MLPSSCTLLTLAIAASCATDNKFPKPPFLIKSEEVDSAYWVKLARDEIADSIKQFPEFYTQKNRVKNIVLFLGDGMGMPTVSATRFYKAMMSNLSGHIHKFPFEDWDFNTMVRTYDLENMVTDSASSATAYLTGTKTRTGMLGLTGAVEVKTCADYTSEEKVDSVLTSASESGKATGIVTTSRVTHATPAAAYGHMAFRDWESDSDIVPVDETSDKCKDLALQLVTENLDINVVLGGGQEMFYGTESPLVCNETEKGKRKDQAKLADIWSKTQDKKDRVNTVIQSVDDFKKLKPSEFDYLLGLLKSSHLPYVLDRSENEVTLPELAEAALKVLQRNTNGFFLFIEGARIDHSHHDNKARKALTEMIEFAETIEKVQSLVNLSETLLIVTADHSHSFELIGQPSRFENLLLKDKGYGPKTLDSNSLIPASYASGPGAEVNAVRKNVSAYNETTLTDKDFMQQALIPLKYASHGGEDVPVYANGPFSWLFHRTIDNTFIAHAMRFAMCLEPFAEEPHCTGIFPSTETTSGAEFSTYSVWIAGFLWFFVNY